jgi:uncharacterized protein (TIGR00730 family)
MQPTPEQGQHFQALAQEVLTRLRPLPHRDLILRMLSSVLRMSEDSRYADLKLTTAALEEMEHAFDVLEIYADVRKVALFGSARSPREGAIYQQALEFASLITRHDFMIITGAGPGVMAAGNEGAGRDRSFGMNICLPFETAANEYIADDPKLLEFKYFFTRKLALVKDSHAIVLCPGGFGTMDEGFEVLTLIQTGKAQPMPVVCLHPAGSGFWDEWEDYVKKALLKHDMIHPDDLSLYKITTSATQACDEIRRFYRRFHSMRYHQDQLIVRLQSPLLEGELEQLNQDFRDLLRSGRFELSSPPQDRAYDSRLNHLTHLSFPCKRGRNGRLRQLIDHLNEKAGELVAMPPERGEGGRLPVETDPAHDKG